MSSAVADNELPPIPPRKHFRRSRNASNAGNTGNHHPPRNSRRRSSADAKRASIPPASPEVISHLITSLSVISQPANSHFESHPSAASFNLPSPSTGSFGVDYGAYARRPEPHDESQQTTSLDELAASPPVVRTSKPTSGYSPLTGAKGSNVRSPSSDSGSRFPSSSSFIRGGSASRPTSPGSAASNNDDTRSIGNLSVERGAAPTPELKHHRSHDSWGKKTGRGTKGLMYMSSRERLRERELERKRLPGRPGSASESFGGGAGSSSAGANNGGRLDHFLAATVISEEEPSSHGNYTAAYESYKQSDGRKPIPARQSSLTKPRTYQKRYDGTRSKRSSSKNHDDDDGGSARNARSEAERHLNHSGAASLSLTRDHSFLLGPDEISVPPRSPARVAGRRAGKTNSSKNLVDHHHDEGAPFPAVSQRRRDELDPASGVNGTRPSRLSPGPKGAKRSNSPLDSLSGRPNPHGESTAGLAAGFPQDEPIHSRSVYPTGYERPASADSVDDAVESYLCSPRLSHKIRHPETGRVISFSEVGDSSGSAVFCCVGMGLTRYITAFYDELALTLRLRLITPDRPGVGDSEPYSDDATTPLSWPDDVYAICQALRINKFSILAHSAGAIYALATALRMPQHIRGRIHLLAPWIPPSQMSVFGGSQTLPPTNAIPTSQKILRALPTPLLKAANSSFMSATSTSITSSLPKNSRRPKRRSNIQGRDGNNTNHRHDNENHHPNGHQHNHSSSYDNRTWPRGGGHERQNGVPKLDLPNVSEKMDQIQPTGCAHDASAQGSGSDGGGGVLDKERQVTYDTRLTHAIWELATTGANPAVDLLVCLERRQAIGFRYVDITRPVVIHHGSRDTRVPVDNVKWLGKAMRRCEVRVLEGEGHGLMASATVMGSVLMEMSKEWEDWMRLTGVDGRKDRVKRGTALQV